jgi:DNA-binding response OmpR family regulator
MRVLIYENTKDRGKLIQDLLSTYRYKTYLNTDQVLSLDKIQHIKPSLLIININNPSHIELLENLKNNKKTNRIPIILISNLGTNEILKRFHNFPHMDYLVEPFKIKNFRHIVERWITYRSMYVN